MSNQAKIIKNIILLITCYFLTISTKALSWPKEALGEGQEIFKAEITKVEVSGNTVIDNSEIEAIISNYPAPLLNFNDLLQLAQRLTDLYVKKGYITSGAFLPQQKIVDGVAQIKIVEGKLERLKIEGRKRLQDKVIRSYFPDLETPLNVNDLERQLKKLERNASIQKVNGELVRGTSSSSSVLILEIEESPPFQTTLAFNNYRSPSIGEYQGIILSSYSNLLGIGDRFSGQYNLTEGFDAYSLGLSLPLYSLDGMIEFEYREGDSRIIEDRFRAADIRAETDSISLQYRQAIVESVTREVAISFGLERRKEQTFLLDEFFSFTPGAESGRSVTSAVNVTGEWTERSSKSVLALRSQVSFGLDFWEATINDDGPDGRFMIWRGGLEWVNALNRERDLLFVFRLATQLTPDSLLTSEKFTIGGKGTVRGSRENEELGDNGFVGTIEIYIPLYKSIQNQTSLNLIPFIDGGVVWDNDGGHANSLMSLGLGLSWNFAPWGRARLDYGVLLIDQNNGSNNSLQENGLTFSVEIKPF